MRLVAEGLWLSPTYSKSISIERGTRCSQEASFNTSTLSPPLRNQKTRQVRAFLFSACVHAHRHQDDVLHRAYAHPAVEVDDHRVHRVLGEDAEVDDECDSADRYDLDGARGLGDVHALGDTHDRDGEYTPDDKWVTCTRRHMTGMDRDRYSRRHTRQWRSTPTKA